MPLGLKAGDLTFLVAAGVATVLLTVASLVVAPEDSTPQITGSSFSTHPSGGRAAFLALKAAGYRVEPSYEPFAALRAGPEETTVVLADPTESPSLQDLRALHRFIETGGVILATGPRAPAFLPGLSPALAPAPDAEVTLVQAALPSALSAGVPRIIMAPASSGIGRDSAYLTIYGTDARPAVLAARIGQGLAIWWAGSTPLTNDDVRAPGHIELVANAIGGDIDRLILWDEFYHGHNRSLASYVAATPMPYAGLQIALIVVVSLLTFSRRRWPIRGAYAAPRSSPLEFVESMGLLYARANSTAGAVATVRARVRRALATGSGMAPGVADDRLASEAAPRAGQDPPALRALLGESAEAASNPNLRPVDARRMVAALQRVARALEATARTGRTAPERTDE